MLWITITALRYSLLSFNTMLKIMSALVLVVVLSSPAPAHRRWMTRRQLQEAVKHMTESFDRTLPLVTDIKILENRSLRVLVHEMVPYVTLSNQQVQGFLGDLWTALNEQTHFRCQYQAVMFDEGRALLQAGEADVMLSPVVAEREEWETFGVIGPIATSVYSLYTQRVEENGNSSSYLWTWSKTLWLAYLAILIICTLLLWAMSHIRNQFGLNKPTVKQALFEYRTSNRVETVCLSLGNCVMLILRAATQQGVQIRTTVSSLRTVLVVLLSFTYLMVVAYNSMLVSHLTVGQEGNYFTSIQSIPASSTPFLCVRVNSPVYSMFLTNKSNSNRNMLQPVWQGVVNQGPCHREPQTTADIAASICHRECVVFESENIMASLVEERRDDCSMVPLRVQRVFSQISILVKKHSPYLDIFRSQVMRMKDVGILRLLEKRYLASLGRSHRAGVQHYPVVTIRHVQSLLGVYCSAAITALVLLLVERGWAYHQRRIRMG